MYNQVEFKGREDPLTVAGYHLINGRTELYVGEQDVSLQAMTVTIICAAKPRTVLTHAKSFQPFAQLAAGYYKNEAHPPIYLLVLNELPLLPKNYPLLLFASSERKFRQFLKKLIVEGNTKYIRYAYQVRPQMTREVLTMAGISTSISRKDLEFMAGDIGPELVPFLQPEDLLKGMDAEKQRQLLALLSVEERLSGISPAERLSGISPAERLSGISPAERLSGISTEELIKGIRPEQRKALFELLLKMLAAGLEEKPEMNGKSNGH